MPLEPENLPASAVKYHRVNHGIAEQEFGAVAKTTVQAGDAELDVFFYQTTRGSSSDTESTRAFYARVRPAGAQDTESIRVEIEVARDAGRPCTPQIEAALGRFKTLGVSGAEEEDTEA